MSAAIMTLQLTRITALPLTYQAAATLLVYSSGLYPVSRPPGVTCEALIQAHVRLSSCMKVAYACMQVCSHSICHGPES